MSPVGSERTSVEVMKEEKERTKQSSNPDTRCFLPGEELSSILVTVLRCQMENAN
jgi:hypothetical protein